MAYGLMCVSRASVPNKVAFVGFGSVQEAFDYGERECGMIRGNGNTGYIYDGKAGWHLEIEDMTRIPQDFEIKSKEDAPKWAPIASRK